MEKEWRETAAKIKKGLKRKQALQLLFSLFHFDNLTLIKKMFNLVRNNY